MTVPVLWNVLSLPQYAKEKQLLHKICADFLYISSISTMPKTALEIDIQHIKHWPVTFKKALVQIRF